MQADPYHGRRSIAEVPLPRTLASKMCGPCGHHCSRFKLERNGAVIAAADGDFASRDLESSQAPLRNLVKDLEIIIDAAHDDLDLDLRAAEVATAVYKHYAKTGFGGADMAIAARYYGLPSLQARGRKRAGITRDQSWAWADIYDGGGGIS